MSNKDFEEKKRKIPFFPDHFLSEVTAIAVVMLTLIVLSLFVKAPLEERANPTETPMGAKSPWYFLFLYQLLKYVPEVVGAFVIPFLAIALLIALPFVDRNPGRKPSERKLAIAFGIVAVLAIVILSYLGSRPYQYQ